MAASEVAERVEKLSFILNTGASEITREIQLEVLQELYQLRDVIQKDPATIVSEQDEATQNEIETLQAENERLRYRIFHLKQNIK